MRYSPCFALLVLVFVALLAAGCTQPGTDLQKTLVPTPAATGSPGISPQGVSMPVTTATSPAGTVTEVLKRGTPDPAFTVDLSVPEKISPGTTLLPDNHIASRPRIIEVNRLGEILWEYPLPEDLKAYTNPGWDVELLPNGNILTLLPRKGVYEINRDKQIVWKYPDAQVSHDADRLENGNTLMVFGSGDTPGDAQVKEVNPAGTLVWSWHARDIFTGTEYTGISDQGWTHTNAVTRLGSGNTLVSLRNFNLIAEINQTGKLVRVLGKGILEGQHDPLVLPNGNLLIANHVEPHTVIELDPSGNVVWKYTIQNRRSWPVRDANRLPNGNTLITGTERIIEVTGDGQIVWSFRLADQPSWTREDPANSPESRGFYKAERISP